MLHAAPRYDPRINELIRAFDDGVDTIAEVCRLVAARAESLGLIRPSHVHLRRLVGEARARRSAERVRRQEIADTLFETFWELNTGRLVDARDLAERIRTAAQELVTQSY